MIHVCRKCGDLSPLFPISKKTVIWLEADERIEREEQFKVKKTEFEIQRDHTEAILNMLADMRQIGLAQIPFTNETSFKDFVISLPSNKGNKEEEHKNIRWTVKQRKPGEIPEWKKKLQQNNNNNNRQEPGQEPNQKTG